MGRCNSTSVFPISHCFCRSDKFCEFKKENIIIYVNHIYHPYQFSNMWTDVWNCDIYVCWPFLQNVEYFNKLVDFDWSITCVQCHSKSYFGIALGQFMVIYFQFYFDNVGYWYSIWNYGSSFRDHWARHQEVQYKNTWWTCPN